MCSVECFHLLLLRLFVADTCYIRWDCKCTFPQFTSDCCVPVWAFLFLCHRSLRSPVWDNTCPPKKKQGLFSPLAPSSLFFNVCALFLILLSCTPVYMYYVCVHTHMATCSKRTPYCGWTVLHQATPAVQILQLRLVLQSRRALELVIQPNLSEDLDLLYFLLCASTSCLICSHNGPCNISRSNWCQRLLMSNMRTDTWKQVVADGKYTNFISFICLTKCRDVGHIKDRLKKKCGHQYTLQRMRFGVCHFRWCVQQSELSLLNYFSSVQKPVW